MLKLTLEAIELVDAIARHGSFAAASERLHKVPRPSRTPSASWRSSSGSRSSCGRGRASR